MTTRTVNVQQIVKVTVDETKFTPEFMSEFRRMMYPLNDLDDHIEHLTQLHARGIADERSFIEGYGWAKDMGIKFNVTDVTHEIATE